VHTDVCVKRAETKEKLQKIDGNLLNYGEELTDTIKSLSLKMY
jgi:hypothetical protein